jgi:hypothetical protein
MGPNTQASPHECLHRWMKLAFQTKKEDTVTKFFHRPTVPPCRRNDNIGARFPPCFNAQEVQGLSPASVVERIRFPGNQLPPWGASFDKPYAKDFISITSINLHRHL